MLAAGRKREHSLLHALNLYLQMQRPAPPLCSEGTLAYFFSTQAMTRLAEAAGFETLECEYARVQVRAAGACP